MSIIYFENKLIGIRSMNYTIPIKTIKETIKISSGKFMIYVKSKDGSVDKLITEKELKKGAR